ncbi:hypothetical protein K1719_026013 [Acacia pycnantha]|nr:hypothetical protein K1719_026013 [Acacia pycnantha]
MGINCVGSSSTISEEQGERSGKGEGDGRGLGDGDGRERAGGEGVERCWGSGSQPGDMSFFVGSGGDRVSKTEQSPTNSKAERRPVTISYKEKLLAPSGLGFLVSHAEEDDIVSRWRGFFAKKNEEMENADRVHEPSREEDMGNIPSSQYPVLSMTEDQYASWCRPWMNSLIIKVLGLSVPKHVLFDRVRRMWKPQQPLKVVVLSNGYYIVSFSNKEERDYAFSEGPWMIDDHYLLVQRWRSNFNPWKANSQRKIVLWVRIPDLPIEFCTVESLGLIGNMIGEIVKIDRSTSVYDKGAFARICVELELQAHLLSAFRVFGEERQLVYEGLHLVCFGCSKYGHEQLVCPEKVVRDGVPEKNMSNNDTDGLKQQSLADKDNGGDKRILAEAGVSDNGKHLPGEASQSDLVSGTHNDERRSIEAGKKKLQVVRKNVQRCSEKKTVVEGKMGEVIGDNLGTPSLQPSGSGVPGCLTGGNIWAPRCC